MKAPETVWVANFKDGETAGIWFESAMPVQGVPAVEYRRADIVDAALAEQQTQIDALQQRVHLCAGYDAMEAENGRLRNALIFVSHKLEGGRIWNGMGWTYNPLHPIHYKPALARIDAALAKQENKL